MPKTKIQLTETEKAYLAGILDGEGSISLVRSFAKRTNGRYVYPLIRIANTDTRLIKWICDRIPTGYRVYEQEIAPHCKTVSHIAWETLQAIDILDILLPYLIIKKERARIVLEMYIYGEICREEVGGYFGNGHPIPDKLIAFREESFALVAKLNERGREVNESAEDS